MNAQTIIAKAVSQIGIKEYPYGSNKVIYNTDYYGRAVRGSDYPWCCTFVWWIFKECNASKAFFNGAKTAYCPAVETYYKHINQWFAKGHPGDLVLYDFYGKGYACHIGIVEKVNSDGTYSVIEGNTSLTSDDNGGSVMRRVRKTGIRGFARPSYNYVTKEDDKVNITLPVLKKGSNGATVQSLQMLLIAKGFPCGDYGADGDFGAGTDKAVKAFQSAYNLGVDGIVGAHTWETLLTMAVEVKKASYSVVGITHVIEIEPLSLKHIETQKATYNTPCKNFVNSLYFMPQKIGGCFPQGHAASEGKIISNYATHGKPVATLIVHTDGSVEMAYVEDLNTISNLWFAVSGYGVYPSITASKEGFTGQFSDVTKSTNRPIIGYRKSDNKIVIAVRSSSSSTRAKETAKNLELDFAISLDGGGSTTLKVDGIYHFKGDGRQLWGGITW